MVLNTDHYVYVKSDDYSWRPGKLLDQDGTTATVSVPKFPSEQDIVSGETNHSTETLKVKLKDYPNKTFPLQNVDEKGDYKPVTDMVDLMYLHEVSHRKSCLRPKRTSMAFRRIFALTYLLYLTPRLVVRFSACYFVQFKSSSYQK